MPPNAFARFVISSESALFSLSTRNVLRTNLSSPAPPCRNIMALLKLTSKESFWSELKTKRLLELPFVMFVVSAIGIPSGYSRVLLPGSGIVGTVPIVIVSSPVPVLMTVTAPVSLERILSSPPFVLMDTISTPRKLTVPVCSEFPIENLRTPVRPAPCPNAELVTLSFLSLPAIINSSLPKTPPVSTKLT